MTNSRKPQSEKLATLHVRPRGRRARRRQRHRCRGRAARAGARVQRGFRNHSGCDGRDVPNLVVTEEGKKESHELLIYCSEMFGISNILTQFYYNDLTNFDVFLNKSLKNIVTQSNGSPGKRKMDIVLELLGNIPGVNDRIHQIISKVNSLMSMYQNNNLFLTPSKIVNTRTETNIPNGVFKPGKGKVNNINDNNNNNKNFNTEEYIILENFN